MQRIAHLPYYKWIAANVMAKQPRISALSISHDIPEMNKFHQSKFGEMTYKNYKHMLASKNHIQTSSMGRLIDAVASIMDIADTNSYEAEAAMKLEAVAQQYLDENGNPDLYYDITLLESDPGQLLLIIRNEIINHQPKGVIALKFYTTLVKWIETISRSNKCDTIAFSGGVFQNALLVQLCKMYLTKELLWHKEFSPNDECISFGQLAYHAMSNKQQHITHQLNSALCV
jgi:hydrogenase maturation protein HypF